MRVTILFSVLAAALAAINGEQHVLGAGAAANAVKCDVCKKAVPIVVQAPSMTAAMNAACGSYATGSVSRSACQAVALNFKPILNASKKGCWKDDAGTRKLISPCPDLPAAACGFLSDASGTFCEPLEAFKNPLIAA